MRRSATAGRQAIHPDDLTSFVAVLGSHQRIRHRAGHRCALTPLRRSIPLVRVSLLRRTRGQTAVDRRWCWLGSFADESASADGRLRRLLDVIPIQMGFLNTVHGTGVHQLKSLRDFNMTFEQLKQWTSSGIIHADDHETNHNTSRLCSRAETYDVGTALPVPEWRLSMDACLCASPCVTRTATSSAT